MLENQFSGYVNPLHNHMQQGGPSLFSFYLRISLLYPILLIRISEQYQAHIYILHKFPYFLFLFSLHQSPLLLVLVQMWGKLRVLDHLLLLLLEKVLSTDQHEPNWYRLDFHFLLLVLYLVNIFSSWFRLCSHNLFCFPLITSFHFIFHNFASTWFFTVIFQFLPVDMKTFMLSFIFFAQDFIYLIFGGLISFIPWAFQFFFSFIPWTFQFFVCLH